MKKTVLVVCYGHYQAQSRVAKMGEQEDRGMGVHVKGCCTPQQSGVDGLLMATWHPSQQSITPGKFFIFKDSFRL